MSVTTLATSVTVYPENAEKVEANDVLVEVFASSPLGSGPAFVWLGGSDREVNVRLELNGAERIALIEALGGTR